MGGERVESAEGAFYRVRCIRTRLGAGAASIRAREGGWLVLLLYKMIEAAGLAVANSLLLSVILYFALSLQVRHCRKL